MELCEQLKEEYLKEVESLISEYKKNATRLREEDSNDEAILETIRANVGDIFYTVFNVSYKNSCENAEEQKIKLNKLSKMYIAFFDKIPASWKENMSKDKEHNMMEEYYIEEIKLETADKIKNLFLEYYNKFYKEI